MKRKGESFISLSLISRVYFIIGAFLLCIGIIVFAFSFNASDTSFLQIVSGSGCAISGLFIIGASEIIDLFMNVEKDSGEINDSLKTIINLLEDKNNDDMIKETE